MISSQPHLPSVCIIGSGYCGLLSARYTSMVTPNITIYQSQSQIGGMWILQKNSEISHPNIESDKFFKHFGYLHTSMYSPLISNVPYSNMTMPDFSFPQPEFQVSEDENQRKNTFYKKQSSGHSEFEGLKNINFITRAQYFEYIQEYAYKFGIEKLVRFNTLVVSVKLTQQLSADDIQKLKILLGKEGKQLKKFIVETIDSRTQTPEQKSYDSFDYVIVANGHLSQKYLPILPGLKEIFKGSYYHMHDLRNFDDKELYEGKVVSVVGSGMGAMDLVWKLLFEPPADNMQIIAQDRMNAQSLELKPFLQSKKLILKPRLLKLVGEHTGLFGNEQLSVDLIVFSTGYSCRFPFLQDGQENTLFHGKLDKYNKREAPNLGYKAFGPLYLKTVCVREPNLLFMGITDNTIATAMMNIVNAIMIARIIKGKIKVSQAHMMKQAEKQMELEQARYGKGNFTYLLKFHNRQAVEQYTPKVVSLFGLKDNVIWQSEMKILRSITKRWYEIVEKGQFKGLKEYYFAKQEGGGRYFCLVTPKDLFDNQVIIQ